MRFHNLDLNLLVVLDSLLQERSVSQTAQALRLTQPAISNALSRLRLHFEDDLLVQVGRKMVPTPFAETLAEPVRHSLEGLRRIVVTRSEFDPAAAERTFTFTCSDYVFNVLMTGAIRKLVTIAPRLKIIGLLTSDQSAPLLGEGKVDFMVAPDRKCDPAHPRTVLFTDRFACIAWKENPLIGNTISLEKYLELEHVSVTLGPHNPPHIEQQSLDDQGVIRNIMVHAPTFASVAEAVVGTNMIATVHARHAVQFAQRLPVKVFAPPVEIATFTENLQWHKNKEADAGTLWMRDFLIEHARTL
jgi:LysR family nod box-dependent transcriptional activator